jgi:DNA-binding transcriptional regulator YbjK
VSHRRGAATRQAIASRPPAGFVVASGLAADAHRAVAEEAGVPLARTSSKINVCGSRLPTTAGATAVG